MVVADVHMHLVLTLAQSSAGTLRMQGQSMQPKGCISAALEACPINYAVSGTFLEGTLATA